MNFQPVIPLSGNAGWSFLSRTREAQEEAFRASTINQRETAYFREQIGEVLTAEALVSDRRLLSVALGAFGLDEDINNTFFIRKVLEEGTQDDEAFANRLGDKRYFQMAEAFGFDLSPPNTQRGTFGDVMTETFLERQFEVAVGDSDPDMRLALGLDRELATLADRDLSEAAEWFTVLGTPPLRRVFETALNIPAATSGLDLDRQLELFRDKAQSLFGISKPSEIQESEQKEDLIRRFLLQSEVANLSSSFSSGSVALSLLQSQQPLF